MIAGSSTLVGSRYICGHVVGLDRSERRRWPEVRLFCNIFDMRGLDAILPIDMCKANRAHSIKGALTILARECSSIGAAVRGARARGARHRTRKDARAAPCSSATPHYFHVGARRRREQRSSPRRPYVRLHDFFGQSAFGSCQCQRKKENSTRFRSASIATRETARGTENASTSPTDGSESEEAKGERGRPR